ncbi:MAG: family acetyltransferase [Novosphingobium sp.]|nr:family acetyltransferase [Novosphingobium sp.]
MDDWSRHLTTRTGLRLHVRPARPADEGTVAEFFTHVTNDDLRFRFLTGLNEPGHERIAALTHIDHDRTEDFLAFTEDGSTMIATAMLACDAAMDRGEVAITIRKDRKREGIGWALLAHIARYAEANGVRTLESVENRENHAAIDLERDMGFTVEPYPGDPTLVLVSRKLELLGLPGKAVTQAA